MFRIAHSYDLSFVSPSKGCGPRIVFTVETKSLPEHVARLEGLLAKNDEYEEAYLGARTSFTFGDPDLLGHRRFGYSSCGFVVEKDLETEIHIELGPTPRLQCNVLTIHLLAIALYPNLDEEGSGNRMQQAKIQTRCDPAGGPYAHAISGSITPALTLWLIEQAPEKEYAPIVEAVPEAMRQAWHAVVQPELQEYAAECRGWVADDGRFSLKCFGNACDLSVYPDNMSGDRRIDEIPIVEFSCHNLDLARQQVTLIAGLAKMCELARAEGG